MAFHWDYGAGFVPFLANSSQLRRLGGVFRNLAFILCDRERATCRIIFFSARLPAAEWLNTALNLFEEGEVSFKCWLSSTFFCHLSYTLNGLWKLARLLKAVIFGNFRFLRKFAENLRTCDAAIIWEIILTLQDRHACDHWRLRSILLRCGPDGNYFLSSHPHPLLFGDHQLILYYLWVYLFCLFICGVFVLAVSFHI